MRKYILTFLLAFLSGLCILQAQDRGMKKTGAKIPNENKWVVFRVDSVLYQRNDTVWVVIDGGTEDNIIQGATGNTYSVYSSDNPDRGTLILGTAYHISAESHSSSCYIVLNNPSDPSLRVFTNDLVELSCNLPGTDESYLLTRIAQLHIQFNDLDGNPLFTQRELLFNTDWQKEEELLDIMADDVRETLEFILDYTDDNPSWKEPMEGGRYDGHSMLDAMLVTTSSDIAAFLNFVIAFPGKYMGNTWKINETYATWLINATPPGDFNYRTFTIINELGEDELSRYIGDNTFYIQDSTLEKYNEYFNEYLNASELDKAEEWNNKLILMSIVLENNYYKSIFQANRGLIKAAREDWEGSILDFNKAIETDPDNAVAYNNLGIVYKREGAYDKAIKAFEKSITLNPLYAGPYYNIGVIYAHYKNPDRDYKKAIRAFKKLMNKYPASPLMEQTKVWIETLQKIENLEDTNESLELTIECLEETIENLKQVDTDIEQKIRE